MIKFVREKELVKTIAHPEGKPMYTIEIDGVQIGWIKPYSSTYDRKPKGCPYVTSRKNVTRYSLSMTIENPERRIISEWGIMNATEAKKIAMRHASTIEDKI